MWGGTIQRYVLWLRNSCWKKDWEQSQTSVQLSSSFNVFFLQHHGHLTSPNMLCHNYFCHYSVFYGMQCNTSIFLKIKTFYDNKSRLHAKYYGWQFCNSIKRKRSAWTALTSPCRHYVLFRSEGVRDNKYLQSLYLVCLHDVEIILHLNILIQFVVPG